MIQGNGKKSEPQGMPRRDGTSFESINERRPDKPRRGDEFVFKANVVSNTLHFSPEPYIPL